MPVTTAATTAVAMTAVAAAIAVHAATSVGAAALAAVNAADPVVRVVPEADRDADRVGAVPSVADATGAAIAVHVRARRVPVSLLAHPCRRRGHPLFPGMHRVPALPVRIAVTVADLAVVNAAIGGIVAGDVISVPNL